MKAKVKCESVVVKPKQLILLRGVIWILKRVFDTKPLDDKLQMMRTQNQGTVGRELADLLDSRGHRLIPKFESHDLKHILLGYDMTREDEIRMQVCLLGNGNYSLPCLLPIMLTVLYPSLWPVVKEDYRLGKRMKSVYHLTLDGCMERNLSELRVEYGIYISTAYIKPSYT